MLSGLYYKPMTIVNDDSRVINKLEPSLTDDTRVIIYERHMFIVQATGLIFANFSSIFDLSANDETRTLNLGMMRRGFNPCATAASLVSYYVLIAVEKIMIPNVQHLSKGKAITDPCQRCHDNW